MNLENIDCLTFLKKIQTESVAMVLVDPPYYKISKESWDHQWKTEDVYLNWCNLWVAESYRILKPNGTFIIWGTTKTDTFLKLKLTVLNRFSWDYKNWIIWSYDWGGRTKENFARKHEDCLVYAKGQLIFNADAVRIPYKMKKNVRKGATNNPLGKIPTDVWEQNNHTASKEYVNWHPTQKPILLLQRLIKAYTNPGDIVLDCFSGSGSTAVAALNSEREFQGCELDKTYYEKSLIHIEKLAGLSLYS